MLALDTVAQLGRIAGHRPGWWFLGMLFEFLLVAALVVLAVVIAQRFTSGGSHHPPSGPAPAGTPSDQALAQLRLRYARGEISRDDYLQVARDLGAPVTSGEGEADRTT